MNANNLVISQKLNGKNFDDWYLFIKNFLTAKKIFQFSEEDILSEKTNEFNQTIANLNAARSQLDPNNPNPELQNIINNLQEQANNLKQAMEEAATIDAMVNSIILANVSSSVLKYIRRLDTAFSKMNKLKELYKKDDKEYLNYWHNKLYTLKANNISETIETINEIMKLFNLLQDTSMNPNDWEKFSIMHKALPENIQKIVNFSANVTPTEFYQDIKNKVSIRNYSNINSSITTNDNDNNDMDLDLKHIYPNKNKQTNNSTYCHICKKNNHSTDRCYFNIKNKNNKKQRKNKFAIGAILSQKSQKDNKIHPIAFFSRSLTAAEKNYPIYDKELLAIVEALEQWRHLLKGTSNPFTIFSDHHNLLYQKKPEKMSQRLVRWALFLSEFNFKITYRAGSSNGKPDALSRRPDYASNEEELSSDIPFNVLKPDNFCAAAVITSLNDQILHEYKKDEYYKEICNKLNSKQNFPKSNKFSLSNNFLLFNGKIYVPPNCRSSVLNICHDSPSAGHFGFKKTFSLINRDFWWSSMIKDIKEYIKSCEICCRSKDSRHKPYGFLNPLKFLIALGLHSLWISSPIFPLQTDILVF